jgi:hypothetical protein
VSLWNSTSGCTVRLVPSAALLVGHVLDQPVLSSRSRASVLAMLLRDALGHRAGLPRVTGPIMAPFNQGGQGRLLSDRAWPSIDGVARKARFPAKHPVLKRLGRPKRLASSQPTCFAIELSPATAHFVAALLIPINEHCRAADYSPHSLAASSTLAFTDA